MWEAELICVEGLRLSAQLWSSGTGEVERNGCNPGRPDAGRKGMVFVPLWRKGFGNSINKSIIDSGVEYNACWSERSMVATTAVGLNMHDCGGGGPSKCLIRTVGWVGGVFFCFIISVFDHTGLVLKSVFGYNRCLERCS